MWAHFDFSLLINIINIGPGCSSVGYGATQEIGPFLVDNEGNDLKFNPYAWNKGILKVFFFHIKVILFMSIIIVIQ